MKSEVTQQVTDTAVQAVLSKAPYLGVGVTVVYGYSLNEWLAIFGIVFTVLTFGLNWYMQKQRIKIMQEGVKESGVSRYQPMGANPYEQTHNQTNQIQQQDKT